VRRRRNGTDRDGIALYSRRVQAHRDAVASKQIKQGTSLCACTVPVIDR
jgi:hypothetical protein